MFMHKDYVDQYPKCVKLLQTLPVKLKRTKVFEAFLTACTAGASKQAAAKARTIALQALKWGAKPAIVVHEGLLWVPTGGGKFNHACGYLHSFDKAFNSKAKSKIQITSFWFDAVEHGSRVDQAKNERRLTTTFLHEAVHWVREEAGAPDEIDISFKEPPKEAGHYFEELAFGISNVCTEPEIWDSMLSRHLR
jgi:Metallopeptidase toxin 3